MRVGCALEVTCKGLLSSAALEKAGMQIFTVLHNVGPWVPFTGSEVTENSKAITAANVNQTSSEINETTPLSSLCGPCRAACIFLALFRMMC